MIFLAMIIALSLQQVLQPGNFMQRDAWLLQWDSALAARLSSETLRAATTLGVIALAVHWALAVVDGWLLGLFKLLLTASLLLWSLGRDDYHTALERYEARSSDDPEGARQALDPLWAPVVRAPDAGDYSNQELALQRLVYSGYARWFAPLFFFVVAGPIAAVLYRVLASLAADDRGSAYLQVLRWADWVPARILGLTFALVGDFMAVSHRASLTRLMDATPAPQFLWEFAKVACSNTSGARVLGDLLYRCAGLWLLGLSTLLILA